MASSTPTAMVIVTVHWASTTRLCLALAEGGLRVLALMPQQHALHRLESSVPGLGPLMRFTTGARFAAPRIACHLAATASRRPAPQGDKTVFGIGARA